ncbi:MAG: ATP-binding cassette domain-containing protein [Ilumatobacteraceae bacterium]|nr:ATP-binding cassette domain-containing protein [Ilumatobacteraceae bacterium]
MTITLPPDDPVIDIEDAFVLHRGRTHDVAALRGLTLRVDPGERIVVRGPSGAGKSTLVAAVTAQVSASAGRIRLFGHDIAQMDHAAAVRLRTAHVGVVSQRSGLDLIDDLDCLDNVAVQSRLAGMRRDQGRRAAAATLHRLGLDHLTHRRPTSLSGGERQRVALAAALAHGPGLVIADEPTGELDASSADQVYDFLREHAERTGAALLVVTHDARAERVATRVLTIHDGRLSEETLAGRTTLVVDGRGWVRLPDSLRADARIAGRAVAVAIDGNISLVGSGPVSSSAGGTTHPIGSYSVGVTPAESVAVSVREAEIDLDTTTIGPVSMELRRGQVTVITGRSGSGKTSVLSIVLGVGQPTRGVVERMATSFGCAPQTAAFADQQSVIANIDLVRAIRSEPFDGNELGLLDALGLEGLADRPAGALSGGERQRLALARALAVEAELVVLDEPTSQLDRATARLISRAIRDCADRGACVVCASHDEELLAVADQIIDLGAAPGTLGVACH